MSSGTTEETGDMSWCVSCHAVCHVSCAVETLGTLRLWHRSVPSFEQAMMQSGTVLCQMKPVTTSRCPTTELSGMKGLLLSLLLCARARCVRDEEQDQRST